MVSLLIVQKLEMTENDQKKIIPIKVNTGKERYVFVCKRKNNYYIII